ncbi:MAG: glycosyltransferase family 1 protein [Planctomycetota bacterium]|nr:MAG: glycosyltransferase family 1 protein [Planctomycetota bacterium]
MRVAIDVSVLERTPPTGVEKALLQLLRGLADADADHEYLLVAPRRPPALPPEPDARFRFHALGGRPRRGWRERLAAAFARRQGVDLWHSPVQAIPFLLDRPRVATMHEISWLETRGVGDEGPLWKRRAVAWAVARAADLVVCVSRRTRLNFLALHPAAGPKTVVVPHGVDHRLVGAEPDPIRLEQDLGLPAGRRYFLVVGRALKRKGLPHAIRAFRAFLDRTGAEIDLVLAGPRNRRLEQARSLARRLGLAERVRTPGYVPEPLLPVLYAGAAALLVPSESEGFGLPLLEGMAAGTPVIAHRASSLPEVAGDAALLIDFQDPAAAAAAMERAIGPERSRLVAAGRARAAAFPEDLPARRLLELWPLVVAGGGWEVPE